MPEVDYTNGCQECGTTDVKVVRGYCLNCWPQIRKENKALKEGFRASKTRHKNPYDVQKEYKLAIAWEIGFDAAKERDRRHKESK